MDHLLELALLHFVRVSLHDLVTLTLREGSVLSQVHGACVAVVGQAVLARLFVLLTLAHATVFEILKSTVVGVVFERHSRVEHLYHLTWLCELYLLLFCLLHGLGWFHFFWLVRLNKANLSLEDLTWEL